MAGARNAATLTAARHEESAFATHLGHGDHAHSSAAVKTCSLKSEASVELAGLKFLIDDEDEDEDQGGALTRRAFLHVLQQDVREEKGIFMMPFSLLMLALFIGIVMGHERSMSRQSLRSAIRDDIVENSNYDILNGSIGFKDIDNVNVPAAVIDWMRLGYFDHMLWKGADANGALAGTYLQYNKIIGGVRFLTQRYNESTGECNFEVSDLFQTPCMHLSNDDWQAEGYDDLAFSPDGQETATWSAGPWFDSTAIQPNRVDWFMMSESQEIHANRLDELLNQKFVDRQTRHVMLSMIVFNADLHLLILVEANFFFARTGRVWPLLRIKTVDPDPFADLGLAAMDGIFLVFLFGNVLNDMRTVFKFWRKVGCGNLNRNLPHGILWYILDAVGIFFGIALATTYWRYWTAIVSLGKELEDNYVDLDTDQAKLRAFFENVEQTVHSTALPYQNVLLIYPFSLMMRLGLGFSGNPRLAMFMHVFAAAKVAFYHFAIVFMSFLIAFTILSMLMFGREMEAYSTMSRALQSNIQMLFGDVDWDTLSVLGFVKGTVFYWCFHTSLVLIVFNILIAVILDTYETLREEIGRRVMPETLWQQLVVSVERKRSERRLGHVSLYSIWMTFLDFYGKESHSEELFTLEDLKKVVPKMPEEQAEALIAHAEVELWKNAPEESPLLRLPHDLGRLRRVWKHLAVLLLDGNRSALASPRCRRQGDPRAQIANVVMPISGREGTGSPAPGLVALPPGFEKFAIHDDKQLRLDGAVATLRLALKLAESRLPDADAPKGLEQDKRENVARAIRLSLALCDWYPTASSSPVPGMMPGGYRLPSEANGSVQSSSRCLLWCQ